MIKTLVEWRAAIKARDMKCMECGDTKGLVAHHIIPKATNPLLKLDINNGKTLCIDCHIKHHKENPVKERLSNKVPMKRQIKKLEEHIKDQEKYIKEQEEHIKELEGRIKVLIPDDGREVVAKNFRIEVLDKRINNLSLANMKLRDSNKDLMDKNKNLQMAMYEYEFAYAELVKTVPV